MDGFGGYLLLFIAVYLAVQGWLMLQARKGRGRPAPRLDDMLDPRHLSRERLVLYFWRPGCQLCAPTSRLVDALLETRDDIVKVNVLEEPDLAERFRVQGTPTLIVLRGRRIEQVLVGSRDEGGILALLDPDGRAGADDR